MIDFTDAEPQSSSDVIPNGTIVRVNGVVRPGGVSRPGHEAADAGYLTASKTSDVLYLSWEFTVLEGPFARRKFWQNTTVAGGTVNEKGESKAWNITKSTIRAMLNSARNVRSDDESPNAKQARQIASWADLNGIEFVCKVRVQPAREYNGQTYQASNSIGQVIEPGSKEYGGGGSDGGAPASAPAAPKPSWQAQGASAAAAKPAAAGGMPAWAR